MSSAPALLAQTCGCTYAQELKQLHQEREEARQQVQQASERLGKVRQEQKAIVEARNKHEKRCVACSRS